MTLEAVSLLLVYSAMGVYTLAMLGYFADLAGARATVPQAERALAQSAEQAGGTLTLEKPAPATAPAAGGGERWGRAAVSLTVLAFGLHALGLLTRGLAAQRAPWGNMYEFTLTATLVASGALLIGLRAWRVRAIGAVVVPVLLLLLGLSVRVLYVDAGALVPALESYWLWIHVSAACIGAGGFTLGAACTVLHLAKLRGSSWTASLPAADRLERLAYKSHVFAFPVFTFAVMAGAVWAESSWGRYWGWDPKETWSFVTWVFYAAALHARATGGWRGRGSDTLALLGYVALLFNLFGVNLLMSGLHSYSGV